MLRDRRSGGLLSLASVVKPPALMSAENASGILLIELSPGKAGASHPGCWEAPWHDTQSIPRCCQALIDHLLPGVLSWHPPSLAACGLPAAAVAGVGCCWWGPAPAESALAIPPGPDLPRQRCEPLMRPVGLSG